MQFDHATPNKAQMISQSQMHGDEEPASKTRTLGIVGLCLGTWVLFLRLILSKI
jgi:hypothetical protein